jgi:hypothetical protein
MGGGTLSRRSWSSSPLAIVIFRTNVESAWAWRNGVLALIQAGGQMERKRSAID